MNGIMFCGRVLMRMGWMQRVAIHIHKMDEAGFKCAGLCSTVLLSKR